MKISAEKIVFLVALFAIAGSFVPVVGQTQDIKDKDPNIVKDVEGIREQVREIELSTIPTTEDTTAKQKLHQLIEQLGALELPKRRQSASQKTPSEKSKEQTSEKAQSQKQQADKQSSVTSAVKKPDIKTEDVFIELTENPQRVVAPLEAAETLFLQNYLQQASAFYKLALERIDIKEGALDRAWSMFQLANCIRHIDPDQAYQVYDQLMAEYPNSQWTPIAQSQQILITWNKQNDPQSILNRYLSYPNSI